MNTRQYSALKNASTTDEAFIEAYCAFLALELRVRITAVTNRGRHLGLEPVIVGRVEKILIQRFGENYRGAIEGGKPLDLPLVKERLAIWG